MFCTWVIRTTLELFHIKKDDSNIHRFSYKSCDFLLEMWMIICWKIRTTIDHRCETQSETFDSVAYVRIL